MLVEVIERQTMLDIVACHCNLSAQERGRPAGMIGLQLFFSSRRRHTNFDCDWSSDVCSSDLTGAAGNSLPPGPDAAAHSPTPAPFATGALRTASSPVALDPFFAGLEERALRILYPTAPLERDAAGFGPGGNSATPAPDAIGVLRDPYPVPSDVSRSVPLDPFFADLEERALRILYPTAPLERDAAGFGPGGTSATPAPEAIGVLRDSYPVADAAHSVPLDPFFADLEERTFRF